MKPAYISGHNSFPGNTAPSYWTGPGISDNAAYCYSMATWYISHMLDLHTLRGACIYISFIVWESADQHVTACHTTRSKLPI